MIGNEKYAEGLAVDTDSKNGITTVTLNKNIAEEIFGRAKAGADGLKTVSIEVPEVKGSDTYGLKLPAKVLSSEKAESRLIIKCEAGIVALAGNMLYGTEAAGADMVGISIGKADTSGLSPDVRRLLGGRPVVELKLTSGSRSISWNNPDAPVTVSIPYTPTKEELADPEHITVWYIDGSGNPVPVPSGRFDPATGMVTFTTAHFSSFAAVYVTKTFDDLGSVPWAKKFVEVLASKGILKESADNEFAPKAGITRADFLYGLIRALGADSRVDGNFGDIAASAYYYREIGIAKKLGITIGVGNNKFNPDAGITRQDMMVMTEKALRVLKKLEAQGISADLGGFTDRTLVAAYAVNSAAAMIKEGLITGSGGRLNPLGSTARAEAAVILYKIYNRYQ